MKLAITGSSSGIGYALAVSLLNEGHEVWGIARSTQLELSKTSIVRSVMYQNLKISKS